MSCLTSKVSKQSLKVKHNEPETRREGKTLAKNCPCLLLCVHTALVNHGHCDEAVLRQCRFILGKQLKQNNWNNRAADRQCSDFFLLKHTALGCCWNSECFRWEIQTSGSLVTGPRLQRGLTLVLPLMGQFPLIFSFFTICWGQDVDKETPTLCGAAASEIPDNRAQVTSPHADGLEHCCQQPC